jgi:hypothetical protein
MDLPTLQATVTSLKSLAATLNLAAAKLNSVITKANVIVNGPYANTLLGTQAAIDAFIAAETPLYLAALTEVETAADAFGSDVLH